MKDKWQIDYLKSQFIATHPASRPYVDSYKFYRLQPKEFMLFFDGYPLLCFVIPLHTSFSELASGKKSSLFVDTKAYFCFGLAWFLHSFLPRQSLCISTFIFLLPLLPIFSFSWHCYLFWFVIFGSLLSPPPPFLCYPQPHPRVQAVLFLPLAVSLLTHSHILTHSIALLRSCTSPNYEVSAVLWALLLLKQFALLLLPI